MLVFCNESNLSFRVVLVQFYKNFCTQLKDIIWKSADDADKSKGLS